MRISTFLLFLCVFASFAANTNSQNAAVNITKSDLSIGEFIDQIEQQTDYLFVYSKNEVNTETAVAVNAGKKSVAQYLNEAFNGSDVNYSFENDYIVLTKNATPSVPQQGNVITGVVVDNFGEPVIGANVIEKGTTNGTITDFDGNYSISVPQGATLQVSYIGYLTKEVTVGTQRMINITLIEDTQTLDEVVVVGYGTMKKSDVTGSISVTSAEDILQGQTFNALEGLRGKAAGVTIMSNSGQPGGAQRVLIRGMSSINTSSDPLYIVDGVAMESMQYLNPNDIERIEVLKDASSAAIYGARGANGVIMVTTKRGLKGEGVSVSYNGSVSLSHVARYMDLMDAAEWQEAFMIGIKNFNKWYADPASSDPAMHYKSEKMSDWFTDLRLFNSDGSAKYDTDWQKEATRTAISHSHQINIQQGGQNSSVGAFLNFTDQQGVMLNTYMKRLNAKLAYDAKPTKYLSTAINLLVNHTWANEAEEGGGAQYSRRTMIEMVPWLPVTLDGEYTSAYTPTNDLGLEGMANPVHVLKTQERTRYRTQIFGNAAFTFHLMEGLDLKTQLGIDANLNQNKFFTPNDLVDLTYPNGDVTFWDYRYQYWQEETYLTYNKTVDKHRINAMAGLSWQERVYREHKSQRRGFSDNYSGADNIGAGTIAYDPSSKYERWAMNSYFLRAAYTYDDKYSATVTARVDGSSKFGKDNKYAFFPSAGFAWNASNEDFMANATFIDQLKLHTSYGITGNSEIEVYRSLATIESGTVLVNGSLVPSSNVKRLPNPGLKWETTGMWDIGVNLNMFRNRLNFDVSYYHKVTRDLLLDRPVPHTTGFDVVMYNIGKVRNQGVDFMMNTVNVETKDFTWSSTFNFNYNKNKILKLGDNDEDIITGPDDKIILRVGESLGSFRGFVRNGVFTEEQKEAALAAGQNVGASIHSETQEIIGNGLPKFTGSFINNFAYKNFDLVVDLQFVGGVDVYQSFLHSIEDRFGKANGLKTILYEGYNGTNPNTMVQAIRNSTMPEHGSLSQQDSRYIANGAYLRGNLIQLGYTFDRRMTEKMKISALRLNLSVNNAFLICSKDFHGFDPEGSSYTGDNYDRWGQNIYFFQYPKARTYTLGLNVTF
ncbi:MAG: TonB-dependent receptor [Tannerellaceae bacterium]|nr:TonB-dependent receptor [Tannerellaceae bacterium]